MEIAQLGEQPNRPRKTSLQQLQEDAEKWFPSRHIRELQALVERHSSAHQIRDLLKQSEAQEAMRRTLERNSLSKYVQDIVESSSAAVQAQKVYDQYFSRISSFGADAATLAKSASLAFAAREYDKYLKPIAEQQDLLDRLQRESLKGLSIQEYFRQIERANPSFAAMDAAKKQMDAMLGSFRDIDLRSFADADEADRNVAREAAETISKAATEQPTLQRSVDFIVVAIQAETQPAVQLMLLFIFRKMLDYLAAGAIGAAMGYYAPTVLGESPQAANKKIKEVAKEAIGVPGLLADYRFVSTTVVIVRQNPRARSPEIGRLRFGNPVKLLRKERGFALVVWTDHEAGAEIQGWIFSRYLSKFD